MKILATILNGALIPYGIFILIDLIVDDFGGSVETEFVIVLTSILLVCAVVNIIALWLNWFSFSTSWAGLYFKRKALEEQKRIEALKGDIKNLKASKNNK